MLKLDRQTCSCKKTKQSRSSRFPKTPVSVVEWSGLAAHPLDVQKVEWLDWSQHNASSGWLHLRPLSAHWKGASSWVLASFPCPGAAPFVLSGLALSSKHRIIKILLKIKKCSCDQKEKSYITWLKFKPYYTIQRHPVTLEWFSIQVLVNSEIFKLSLNLSLTRLMGQIACYELKRDLRPVMLKEIFHDSLKISKFTRISMENHSSMTGKIFFSRTNPSNFRRPLQSLLLRYTAENLQVT